MGHLLGYARVSTTDQQPHLQVDALERAGCYRVFTETASVHISNILRKLQVTSRVQAATAAHRLGLVDEDPPKR